MAEAWASKLSGARFQMGYDLKSKMGKESSTSFNIILSYVQGKFNRQNLFILLKWFFVDRLWRIQHVIP